MRLLYTFKNDSNARTFSKFLIQEGVDNKLEITSVTDWGDDDYGTLKCQIWVVDEDLVDTAHQWLDTYLKNPSDSKFKEIKTPPSSKSQINLNHQNKHKPHIKFSKSAFTKSSIEYANTFGAFTFYLILFCTIVFFATQVTKRPFEAPPANIPLTPLYASPIKKHFLYDYPTTYTMVDKLVKAYGFDKLFEPQNLPPEGKFLLTQMYKNPYWQGFYYKAVAYFTSSTPVVVKAQLFEKIREGEIWRLITPIFLHADIFHLFFNMIWLLVLGVQMEKRLGIGRLVIFIIFSALFSNTAQYLMSGPDFLGFSGVLCGMIVFVWLRQKNAPWEGYQLQPSTMAFISIFIGAMFGIQLISFALETLGQSSLAPPIANTAHLSGALAGLVMAKIPYFSWNVKT